ncbi:hypothetical protein LGN04_02060 [Burkholderia multivorans]|nr:hypothetical protein [Burkholderia multivorans]
MNEIRKAGIEAIENGKNEIVGKLNKKSIKQIFREELVFWETEVKTWCREQDYYEVIADILKRCGYDISHSAIGFNLSVVSKEIGWDRKSRTLDGRKATLKKGADWSLVKDIARPFIERNKLSKKESVLAVLESELDYIESELFPALIEHRIAKYRYLSEELLESCGFKGINAEYLRFAISKLKKARGVKNANE